MEPADLSIYLAKLKEYLATTKNDEELFEAIVNAPFFDKYQTTSLDLGIVVLLMVDKKNKTIDRIALSNTEQAKGAVEMSAKPFNEIRIPYEYKENIIAQAISENQYQVTADWSNMFNPELSPEEARFNQAGAGIGCSIVYPLVNVRDGGAMIFSYYQQPKDINEAQHSFMRGYIKVVGEALRQGR